VADAILRDSELDGVLFRKTEEGRKLSRARTRSTLAMFALANRIAEVGIA
jgi:hypothetical protein